MVDAIYLRKFLAVKAALYLGSSLTNSHPHTLTDSVGPITKIPKWPPKEQLKKGNGHKNTKWSPKHKIDHYSINFLVRSFPS